MSYLEKSQRNPEWLNGSNLAGVSGLEVISVTRDLQIFMVGNIPTDPASNVQN
ncbi:hypothetical protein [Pseudocalidococcus azoricus]|uniref:hypothetical protein n=1 Tax=Pseudocalidococcus azoricus TaxID=3110322 RepID=UPI002AF6B388|nr:hypothetical protein [Pseudocalidococcus azoricus]